MLSPFPWRTFFAALLLSVAMAAIVDLWVQRLALSYPIQAW